jgi:hypothetical protein
MEFALVLLGIGYLIVSVWGLKIAFSLPTIRRGGHLEAGSTTTSDLGLLLMLLVVACCRGEGLGGGRLGSKTKLEVEGELLMDGGGGGCRGSKLKFERGGEVLKAGCCCCRCCGDPPMMLGDELLCGIGSKPITVGTGEDPGFPNDDLGCLESKLKLGLLLITLGCSP